MAEFKERPKIRSVEIAVETKNGTMEHKGDDLDDVLRAILFDMKRLNKWPSTKYMAEQLGMPQPTLASFMDEDRTKTRVSILSTVCAVLHQTPIEMFHRHELYPWRKGERPQFADDLVFSRFPSLLTRGDGSRLLTIIERLKDAGVLEEALTIAEKILPTRS